MLDNAILKDVASKKMVTPAARREAVARAVANPDVSDRAAATGGGGVMRHVCGQSS